MNMTRLSEDLLDDALRAAAEALIQSLQAIPKLRKATRVAIIGGYAVQHYVGTHRRTRDVDVLLFRPDRPIDTEWIRKELVSRFPTFFQESAQPLFFKYTEEDWIQVDIIPEYLPPYLPAHAMTLDEVDLDHLPFLDPLDLLAYKVHCSSMRSSPDKREKDAMDVMWLWKAIFGAGSDGRIFRALSLEKDEDETMGESGREEQGLRVETSSMAPTALPSGCGFCGKKDDLLRCSGCKVMFYCGREHEVAHRPSHKSACRAIRGARLVMEREESAIHNFSGTSFIAPGDLFVTSVGMFGRILGARPYMQSRAVLANTMSQIRTVESLEAQLDHYLDLLRLCYADSMNVRGLVMSSDDTWDLRTWSRLYLNIKNADAFEPIEPFLAAFPDLHRAKLPQEPVDLVLSFVPHSHIVAGNRELMYGEARQQAIEKLAGDSSPVDGLVLGPKLPQRLVDLVQWFVPHSHIAVANRELMYGPTRQQVIEKLGGETQVLWMATNLRNEHFWSNLLNPDRDSALGPDIHHWGTTSTSGRTF
ncbi:hypothetical protein CNMCM5793_000859 [Aspergillus hiratsukae]|uniref:MYND-type domain-containing protein n=1 Tax=Aspergillus hiratsukae TaxID=1194566 RepID=A0A8H6PBI1_9EURO|nr:hypothetical protein CNMCM5793_000859 [Aspergillus hiratsukae]KAF7163101.1 hypothetical protein CNMCM6106_000133 [Aspergillus hiratsukae]